MAPHPSATDCTGCLQRSLKISELEGRISTLHSIHQTEQILDSLVPDPDVSAMPPAAAPSVASGGGYVDAGLLLEEVSWPALGARPKISCSTPWTTVRRKRGRDTSKIVSPPSDNDTLLLRNSYAALAEPVYKRSRDTSNLSSPVRLPAEVHFTPCPPRHHPNPPQPTHASSVGEQHNNRATQPAPRPTCSHVHRGDPRTLPTSSWPSGERHPRRPPMPTGPAAEPAAEPAPPSVLVIGSSMVRHVVVPKAQTCCFPGAKVLDIKEAIPSLLTDHPHVSSIIIHVGSNDIKLQQSERLKEHYRDLISTVLSTEKTCIISGPFSSPRYGDAKYSRIRQLHIWLKGYCCQLKIPFIDNFTTFLNRPDLFAWDGLHPNRSGAWLLSLNMDLALRSSSV